MMKLEIGKEYYVDAAHLRDVVSAQDERRFMQNAGHLAVTPAVLHEIFTESVDGKIKVRVGVDLGPFEPTLFAVVDSDKIYKEVSKPGAVKKVDPYNYTPKRIIYNDPATIVFWRDGTKTIVKKNEKEWYNSYNAFCAALAKKIFGTNSEVNRIVRSGYNQKMAKGQKKLEDFKKKVEKARKAKKEGKKK